MITKNLITTERLKEYRSKIDRIRFLHHWTAVHEQSESDKRILESVNTILWRSLPAIFDNFWTEWSSVAKAKNAKKKQKQRVYARLATMAECYDGMLFITLTFSDDVLNNTSHSTRKKYVLRFLEGARDYVGNVDYGKKNGREHYHIVTDSNETIKNADWNYGFSNKKTVHVGRNSQIAIGKYISKTANHSGKETSGKMFCSRRGEKREVDKLPF